MEEKFFDNEMISDDELDEISGGRSSQITLDIDYFWWRGFDTAKHGGLKALFAKFGVEVELNRDRYRKIGYHRDGKYFTQKMRIQTPNVYKIGGQVVTRDEAWDHINRQLHLI